MPKSAKVDLSTIRGLRPKGPWTREHRGGPGQKDSRHFDSSYYEKDEDGSHWAARDKMKAGKINSPSFEHAMAAYPKEKTKTFKGDKDSDDEGKKKKKKGKKGGTAAYGNKAANLGAYVV